ncbi:MAG: hypothetical protein PHV74_04390 [Dehalococcoidia bacterium]|nr:hypothetical protein [Dehalococcoidia bacterium]
MNPNEVAHVVIVPPGKLETALIQQAADVIGKDPYGTRLLLAGKVPRIIAHYDNMQAAEVVAQRLRSLDLIALVCNDSELRKPYQGCRAITLSFEDQAIVFRSKNGQGRRMASKDLFLILKGNIQTEIETESTTEDRKLNLRATLLTGGIPIFRKVQMKTRDKSVRTEGFARFYGSTSHEPSVEILQYDFDYSIMGPDISLSSMINFNHLVTKIEAKFPNTIVDETLMRPFTADIPVATPKENLDINCRLLCLKYQALVEK